jgi:hypothetical protein
MLGIVAIIAEGAKKANAVNAIGKIAIGIMTTHAIYLLALIHAVTREGETSNVENWISP